MLMKQICHLIFIPAISAAIALSLGACGSDRVADDIASARSLTESGDPEAASRICDEVLARNDSDRVGATNYSRLSIAYMELSEAADQTDNIAKAAVSYRRACNIDPDSADAYFRSLSGDDVVRFSMLVTIVNAGEIPVDTTGYEQPLFIDVDSISRD